MQFDVRLFSRLVAGREAIRRGLRSRRARSGRHERARRINLGLLGDGDFVQTLPQNL
jgi:hypothetical protein